MTSFDGLDQALLEKASVSILEEVLSDRFIPWAHRSDNGVENLVAADARCNNDSETSSLRPIICSDGGLTTSTPAGDRRTPRTYFCDAGMGKSSGPNARRCPLDLPETIRRDEALG